MDNQSGVPYDDADPTVENVGPAQDAATDDVPRPSFLSATRASRIHHSLSRARASRGLSAAGRLGSTASAGDQGDLDASTRSTMPPDSTAARPTGLLATLRARRRAGSYTYAHIAAGFCYLGMPVVPAMVLFSPAHRFARFHALQALAFFVALVTLSYALSLVTPTTLVLGILYALLVLVIVALVLLGMTVAIAAFEGYALALPLLEKIIPKTADLQEDSTARSGGARAQLELALASVLSLLALILTLLFPLNRWFGMLSARTLATLGLPGGLPAWEIVAALLSSLPFAAIGLVLLAAFLLGLRKGRFFPPWAGIAGAVLTAAGTGLLMADAIERALASQLQQQFDRMLSASALPRNAEIGAKTLLPQVMNGLESLNTLAQAQHHLLLPGALLLLVGVLLFLFLLSQVLYKN